MAVSNNLTLVEDMESGGPTLTNWTSGGQGATNDGDLFFEGAAATSKKVSGETKGFWMNPGSTFDLTGTGEHVKFYFATTTPSLMTAMTVGIGSVANTDYETHTIDLSFYPASAGWVPIWVEVDAGADTNSPDFANADIFGIRPTLNSTSGNLKNVLCDIIHHGVRPTMVWDGTGGDLDDFITTEDTEAFGVLTLNNGVYTCFASLEIGGAAAETAFDAAGKTIVFPDALWLPAASTFMGFDITMDHASSVYDFTGGAILGGATRQPDIIMAGTDGAADFSNRALTNIRIITMTSAWTMNGGTIANSGQIIPAASTLDAVSIIDPTDDGAILMSDPDDLDNWSNIIIDGAGIGGASTDAAIEVNISAAGPHTIDLDNISFNNRISGSVDMHFLDQGSDRTYTVNVLNGGTTPTVTKDRGSDTVNVVNSVTLTLEGVVSGSQCSIHAASGGDLAEGTELMNESAGGGDVTESFAFTNPQDIIVRVRKSSGAPKYRPFDTAGTITSTGFTLTVNQVPDNISP